MILLDCGNSAVKAQFIADGELRASLALRYAAAWPARLQAWFESTPARRCFLASVLDRERQALLDAVLERSFGAAVSRFGSTRAACGVVNAYAEPWRLGVDRWLALIGAHDGRDCFVIDAGSAITVDLLRGDGRHLGGAIIAGLRTSAARFRQIFAHIDFDHPAVADNRLPGCSTEAAIQLDYRLDAAGQVRELVNRWQDLLDPGFRILLAGGDAAQLQRVLDRGARIRPDLVFRGLYRLATA